MIEVRHVRILTHGNRKAYFTVVDTAKGIEFNDCCLVELPDGRKWIDLYRKEVVNGDKKEYYPVVRFLNKTEKANWDAEVMKQLASVRSGPKVPMPSETYKHPGHAGDEPTSWNSRTVAGYSEPDDDSRLPFNAF